MQLYQIMSQAQAEVPSQVMRQQPVYLEDAHGVVAPFHLEFVTCADVSSVAAPLQSRLVLTRCPGPDSRT
jgi:hypothetical protein